MLVAAKNALTFAENIIKNLKRKRKKTRRLISGVMATRTEISCEYYNYTLTL